MKTFILRVLAVVALLFLALMVLTAAAWLLDGLWPYEPQLIAS